MALTEEQIKQYNTEQGNLANPLSPTAWLKNQKPISASITADTLESDKTLIDLTGVNQKFEDYSSILTGLQNQVATYTKEKENNQKPTNDTTENGMPDYLKNYFDSLQSDVATGETNLEVAGEGVSTAQTGYETQATLAAQSQQELDILNAQLVDISSSAQQAMLTLEGTAPEKGKRDVTSAFLGRQQQEIGRQAAIKSLPLQAQILAKQAETTNNISLLKMATNKLNQAFDIQSKHETNLYNYKKELRDTIYGYMDAQEQAQSNAQAKKEDREYDLMIYNLDYAKSVAKMAGENGQFDIASQITQLDPMSETYNQDVAELQSQIVEKIDPMEKLDIALRNAQIISTQAQTAKTIVQTDLLKEDGVSDNLVTLEGKPLSSSQANALGFAERMNNADVIITELGELHTGTTEMISGSKYFPNIWKSGDRQKYEQAQRNFVNAVLRNESGAAIADSEFDSASKQYFPQPGDNQSVIAQKAINRKTSMNNLIREANISPDIFDNQVSETNSYLDSVDAILQGQVDDVYSIYNLDN